MPALDAWPAEVLVVDAAAAALAEAPVPAVELRGEAAVDAAPPVLKLTLPTASWTLSGGGGTVSDVPDVELVVDVLVVPLAPAEGARLLLAADVPAAPEAPVADVPVVALHCGLAAAAALAAGLADAEEIGATLGLAAALVLAEAPVLAGGMEPGAAAPPPQAASRSEAAASVGRRTFKDMDSSACPPRAGVVQLLHVALGCSGEGTHNSGHLAIVALRV